MQIVTGEYEPPNEACKLPEDMVKCEEDPALKDLREKLTSSKLT